MRRKIVSSPDKPAAAGFGNPLAERTNLAHQHVELLLLANDNLV